MSFGQSLLGEMYEAGLGVPKDYAKAYMFFNLAAAKDSEEVERRDKMEKLMTKEQIAEGQKLTREWLERKGLGQ